MMEIAILHAASTLTRALWNVWARGPAAQRFASLKRAASSMIHRNQRKGWNAWRAMYVEKNRRLALLTSAAASFANRGLRAATNSWVAMVAERKASLAKLADAGKSWVNRARNAAWRKLARLGEQRRKVKRAASSLMNRNQRKGWNGWVDMVAEKARRMVLLSAAASTLKYRGLRAAINSWFDLVESRAAMFVRGGRAGAAFANRELLKGWNSMKRIGRMRGNARRAAASLLMRDLRRGFNGWHSGVRPGSPPDAIATGDRRRCKAAMACWREWTEDVQRLERVARGPFAVAVTQRGVLKGWRRWAAAGSRRAQARVALMHALGRSVAVAVRTWFGLLGDRDLKMDRRRRAFVLSLRLMLRRGWLRWFDYALRKSLQAAEPKAPLQIRIIKWARARKPRPLAQSVSVPADDKRKCQRLFLVPYAALVVRKDGTLFRVADVRRAGAGGAAGGFEADGTVHSGGGCCVIDLVQGVDPYLLARQPLPIDEAIERSLQGQCDLRISADAFDAPEWPAIIPCFFGGVLALTNGIEVRVVDADYGGESSSRYGAIFGGQMLGALAKKHAMGYGAGGARLGSGLSALGSGVFSSASSAMLAHEEEAHVPGAAGFGLRYVRLSLVDGQGEMVGVPVWVDVHELLGLLKTVVAPTCESEEALRKAARFELHRSEQKRMALAALRAARDEDPMAAFAVDESSQEGGIHALLKQLDMGAPTPLLAGGRLSHKASASLNASGSSGDLFTTRSAKSAKAFPNGQWARAGAVVGAGAHLSTAAKSQQSGARGRGKPAMGGMALGLAARARSAGPGAGRGGGRQYASAPSLAPAP